MPKAKPRTLLKSLYLSAAALLFFPAVATADETEPPAKTVVEDCVVPMRAPTLQSAMRVWIDPETGKIRQPTEAERKAAPERLRVDDLLNKSTDGLVVVYRKDGSRFVDLQGRFMHSLVLTRAEDGTLTAHCVDGNDSLSQTSEKTTAESRDR